nr:elevenin precursor [Gryllus bimaculatus]
MAPPCRRSSPRPRRRSRPAPAALLLALLAACTVAAEAAKRVDCRKFVFAPMCRGVAAKRASAPVLLPDAARSQLGTLEQVLGLGTVPPPPGAGPGDLVWGPPEPPRRTQQQALYDLLAAAAVAPATSPGDYDY